MRYYNGKQVLVTGVVCAALAVAVFWAVDSRKSGSDEGHGTRDVVFQGTPVQFVDQPAGMSGEEYSRNEQENILVYKTLNSAVVNITSISLAYNWFLEPTPEEGTGSGSIINQDGYVLTNYHVIKDAERVTVTLADGNNYDGRIVGTDPENDLAVIQFDPPADLRLTTIPLGDSESLEVGQKVLAIGNPFALERTLTTGIVSGLGRPVRTSEGIIIKEMIQTDASINPGNSGGPLLNSRGEMIGINTMIYSPSGGSVGIGFAVPVETAKRVLPELINFGEVRRGWIDITPVQLFPQLVRYADLPISRGILVSELAEGGEADKAGLKAGSPRRAVRAGRNVIYLGGDIIVEVDGTEINTLGDLYGALEDNKPGETIDVRVFRGSQEKVLSLTLVERE